MAPIYSVLALVLVPERPAARLRPAEPNVGKNPSHAKHPARGAGANLTSVRARGCGARRAEPNVGKGAGRRGANVGKGAGRRGAPNLAGRGARRT